MKMLEFLGKVARQSGSQTHNGQHSVNTVLETQTATAVDEQGSGTADMEDRKPTRVLIVDDTYGHRLLCSMAVESQADMRVIGEASNGLQGAERAEELQPDVVVLDLMMPGIDGFEAIPLIRRLAPEARILVWSSTDDPRHEAMAIDLGAHGFSRKSVTSEQLIDSIRGVLPAKRQLFGGMGGRGSLRLHRYQGTRPGERARSTGLKWTART